MYTLLPDYFVGIYPLIYTRMGFTLAQDAESYKGRGTEIQIRNSKTLYIIFATSLSSSTREKVGTKKFPALECYESGEVRDGMKHK